MRLENLDRSDADADLVYMNVLFSTVPEARAAFDTTSGEIYASLLVQATSDALARAQRLVARSHGSISEGWGLWGGGNGSNGSVDGDGNAGRAEHNDRGLDFGLDYRGPAKRWALGVSVGYVDGGLDVDERLSSARYDGWHLGAYGQYGSGGAGLTITGAIDYNGTSASVTRGIAVKTLSRTAMAAVDVDTVALAGEARYGFAIGNGWSAGPSISILHANADLGPVDEVGANALNLAGSGADNNLTRLGGGLFANWQGSRGGLDASAQYIDGRSNSAEVPFALQGAPDAFFGVRSPVSNGAAGQFSLSGSYRLGGGWSISGETRALLGSEESSIAASLSVGFTF